MEQERATYEELSKHIEIYFININKFSVKHAYLTNINIVERTKTNS